MSLEDLEARFLDPGAAPIQRSNTEVIPIRDGREYFDRIYNAILPTAKGLDVLGQPDCIYVLGWGFDVTMDLHGNPPTAPAYQAIGDLLAAKAAEGWGTPDQIDVRIIFNGVMILISNSQLKGHINTCLPAASALRAHVPLGATTPPLANRVLIDFSGAPITGSHHQKAIFVKARDQFTGFVAGLDFRANRLDAQPHNTMTWRDGSPWGWHDAGVQLRGAVLFEHWDNFRSRWREAETLPHRTMTVVLRGNEFDTPSGTQRVKVPINPGPIPPAPSTPPAFPSLPFTQQSVQLLRSRYKRKTSLPTHLNTSWLFQPTDTIRAVHRTLVKAIAAAESYVYVEDQFLADSPAFPGELDDSTSLFPVMLDLLKRTDTKLIFVSSGKSDPDDLPGVRSPNMNATLAAAGEIEEKLVDQLASDPDPAIQAKVDQVVVWRLRNETVHSKLMLIDDRFAAIGSANVQSRSMCGVDTELHVAFVDDANLIRDFRADLWAEHLRIDPALPRPADVDAALKDPDMALGIWRVKWIPAGQPADLWRATDKPPGFAPTAVELEQIGPADLP